MSDIYITGHQNPDLDSVCSAYGYAVLKNLIDKENNYIPVRCGHLSNSTKSILQSLNFKIPPYKRDIYPKVEDVYLKSEVPLDAEAPLNDVAEIYEETNPSVMPVFKNGEFYGLLSVDDITSWVMNEISSKGNVEIIPAIKDIMSEQEPPVKVSDFFEEAKTKLSISKKRGLAVYDDNGFVGFVTRRCFLKAPKHNVILVDHNEQKQSIRGLEFANIVEIIDHHRLDAMKTSLPIFIDAEPLGSTCTIVYRLFIRNELRPDEVTARVLLAGVIGDTLILKSPTTTPEDVDAANALAKICGVDLQEFGLSMFARMEGLKTRDPEAAISSDFKKYTEAGVRIGIGQCEVTTLHDIDDYKEAYLKGLEIVKTKNGLDWAVLMITDVMKEHSVLLCTRHRANKHLEYANLEEGIYDMPGVMSRKKQLLPEIIHAVGI
ncbi:Inorganic pyrophosphatase/exopolyphosphatase [Lachnospiraceae bacterium G11]|nr:Inorganic pyrophosphatase/exopolyphosphatase [Lachnospiraceae bacterium G11]